MVTSQKVCPPDPEVILILIGCLPGSDRSFGSVSFRIGRPGVILICEVVDAPVITGA